MEKDYAVEFPWTLKNVGYHRFVEFFLGLVIKKNRTIFFMRAELERIVHSEEGDYIDAVWLSMIRMPLSFTCGLCGLILLGFASGLARPLSDSLSVFFAGFAVVYAILKAQQFVVAVAEFSWVSVNVAYMGAHPDEEKFSDFYRKISPIALFVSLVFVFFLYQEGVLFSMAGV